MKLKTLSSRERNRKLRLLAMERRHREDKEFVLEFLEEFDRSFERHVSADRSIRPIRVF